MDTMIDVRAVLIYFDTGSLEGRPMTDEEKLARKRAIRVRMAEIEDVRKPLWLENEDLKMELMRLGGCGFRNPTYAATCMLEDGHGGTCSSKDNMPG